MTKDRLILFILKVQINNKTENIAFSEKPFHIEDIKKIFRAKKLKYALYKDKYKIHKLYTEYVVEHSEIFMPGQFQGH